MEGMIQKAKENQSISMAKDVAQRLIENCSPQEQRDFINYVETRLKDHYHERLESAQKGLEIAKIELDNFNAKTIC